jgi:hypothetical protein
VCSADTRSLRRDRLAFTLVSEDEVGDGEHVADVDRAMLDRMPCVTLGLV